VLGRSRKAEHRSGNGARGRCVRVGGEQDGGRNDAQIGKLKWRAVAVFQMAATDDANHQRRCRLFHCPGNVAGKGTVPGLLGPHEAIKARVVGRCGVTVRAAAAGELEQVAPVCIATVVWTFVSTVVPRKTAHRPAVDRRANARPAGLEGRFMILAPKGNHAGLAAESGVAGYAEAITYLT
jgi:hypothetical protein